MKNKLLFILFTILLGYGLTSNSGGRASVSMDGNTGAPGETGLVCGTCHNGGTSFGGISTALVITDPNGLPATDYVPGSTYNIILQGSIANGFPSGYGFQMTALDPNNSSAGVWSNNGGGTTFGTALGRTYWEQSAPAPLALFTSSWTAPGAGKGDVTFYYIMTAVNGDQNTTGDTTTLPLSLTLPEGAPGCPTVNVFATVVTNVTCGGSCNGIAAAQASGGAIPYTYQWSNGATGPIASNLCFGSYAVTLTDANGCTGVGNVSITEPPVLMMQTAVSNVTCNGACDGLITAVAAGGTPPYTYVFNPPNASCAGTYTVIVSDANGCIVSSTATITEPTAITATMTTTPVSTPGGSDGSGTASANGGVPPYTYDWDNGETGPTATALSGGVHCVTITDSNGCTLVLCETVGGGTSSNNQIAALETIQLFPNPANDLATLRLDFKESVDAEIRVVNTLGQTVIGLGTKHAVQHLTEQIDLSGLGVGVYLIEIRVDQEVITRRLVRK